MHQSYHVKCAAILSAACALTATTSASSAAASPPLNVIVFIGDGMGLEHVKMSRMYANNDTAPLTFETFPHFATMTHNNASNTTTDSAASGTALATGVKVNNGVISLAAPGNGADLKTTLEVMRDRGKSTGLVTHATDITDATPAAFGAHTISRTNKSEIASDYFTQSRPNVLFGRTDTSITDSAATSAGYDIVHNNSELSALNAAGTSRVLGHWSAANEPTLPALTTKALDILDNDPDGFFLMVEDEDPDNGGHANSRTTTIAGVLSLRNAVDAAIAWANGRTDTLILVTADHETGGLTVLQNNGAGVNPTVSWGTTGHTQTPVGAWATGPNSELVTGTIDNTDIFRIATVPEPVALPLLAAVSVLAIRRRARCR